MSYFGIHKPLFRWFVDLFNAHKIPISDLEKHFYDESHPIFSDAIQHIVDVFNRPADVIKVATATGNVIPALPITGL